MSNTIQIGDKSYQTKSSWAELTARDLLLWARYIALKLKTDEALKRIAFHLSGIPAFRYFGLTRIQRYGIEDTYRFLTEEITLTKILVAKFRIWFSTYHGPSDELANVEVEEFVDADSAFHNYMLNKKSYHLNRLIAILYRPGGENASEGDRRESYSKFSVSKRTAKVKYLKQEVKEALLMQYMGIRRMMVQRCPHVFSGKNEMRVKNFGWGGVITDLSGSKYGTDLEIKKRLIWDILFIMEKNEVRRIEYERDNPKKEK